MMDEVCKQLMREVQLDGKMHQAIALSPLLGVSEGDGPS